MATGKNSMDSSVSESLTRSYSERSSDRRESNANRDYDGLKQQCDKAVHELQVLRRQNSEANRRCEQTMQEMEYYRSQHHAAMSQLEAAAQESSALRSKYSEMVSEKQRMDREISELRSGCCSQQDVLPESEASDAFNNHYITTINKYEALKEDYDTLRQRYEDVISSHTTIMDKVGLAQEETARLKQQAEELAKERNLAIRERNGLKLQCTQAIRQWDITLREKNEYQEALKKVQQQHEEAMKEINTAITIRMKTNKDVKRLTEERNAAMQEYSLIMSERDTVHKEMEKLSEDLTQAFKRIKHLENEAKDYLEEKKTHSYHIETLKREIASALHDRDKALKECNDFRERLGEFTAKEESHRDAFKSRYDYPFVREGDSNRNDICEMQSTSMDLFNKCQKERMDNLDQANQEIERLRKCLDKQQNELQETVQEAEVSKRRRDWAFNERDKIVLERESIRTLCDRLRKERDRAVSDLVEALRDSDDIKRQRNETTKELNVLKEKMEAQLEKESRMLQLQHVVTGHNYSHDSAIDTDLYEWDTEMLNIDLTGLATNEELGIELVGGRDDPQYPNDSGIYVSAIDKGSFLDGKLRVNDCILRVNNLDCTNVSKRMVMESVRSSGGCCVILVKRRKMGARSVFTTHLQLNNYDHGLVLETGMYISKIIPGSLAAKEGNLAVGDRIICVNNKPMDGLKSAQDAMNILKEPTDVLSITTLKSTHCSSTCTSSIPNNRDTVYKKYANSSTQTDPRLYYRTRYDERPTYTAPPKMDLEKGINNLGKWDTVRAKDLVRYRRNSDKKQNPNSISIDQERDDAIAELDSVIDSYHGKDNNKNKEFEKNGGTWPKARVGAILENTNGTVLHRRKHKERMPLSMLLNNSVNYEQGFEENNDRKNDGKSPQDYYGKIPSKYPMNGSGNESHSRIHSQLYSLPHYPLTLFVPPPMSSHRDTRYSSPSPIHIPSSQSAEPLSLDSRAYCFEPPYSPMPQYHTHSPSVDSSYRHKTKSVASTTSSHSHSINASYRVDELPVPDSYHGYEGGTFPRKKENQRFRIPSNPSVASKSSGGKLSTGSIEKSERGSPLPTFHVEVLHPGRIKSKRCSLPDYCWSPRPIPGELRRVYIDKSVEPLGIQIQCLDSGGVFVSTVNKHSLASQVGLQIGDQLLEVCGINMRSATYQLAANVLRQCGNSITMLVQYNPDKYNGHSRSDKSTSSGAEDSRSETRSGSPTPCNSPTLNRKSTPSSIMEHVPYAMGTISTCKPLERSEESIKSSSIHEKRYLTLEMHKCSNLGISLVGGNAVGIYIHCVTENSLAYNSGLRTGDHILEYNGTDLRHATAEEAAFELAKPADKVTILVQNELERYNEIKDKPGDNFYIRAMFDRTGDASDNLQLQFRKDDILLVDNTMLNGIPGNWRAWIIDKDGYRQQCGIIPSKYKVEEELLLKRSVGDLETDARRTTRRSFFRRKKHQRSDSKELASFSNISLGWSSDSGSLHEETILYSYQKVTRLNSEPRLRPVLILGPLAESVVEKLLADFPDKFVRCIPEVMHCSQTIMEKGIADNKFIDFRKRGNIFECTSIRSVRDSYNKNCHCILDISLSSVERLNYHGVYPIVLLIKFKSTKQIKEVKDTRLPLDKITAKAAKEMYEHALKLESEYRHCISVVIPAGVNVAYMCTQIKAAVESEQKKTLWVPSSTS